MSQPLQWAPLGALRPLLQPGVASLQPACNRSPAPSPEPTTEESDDHDPHLARTGCRLRRRSSGGCAGIRGLPGREREDRLRQRPPWRRRGHLDDGPGREEPRQPDRQVQGQRLRSELAGGRAEDRVHERSRHRHEPRRRLRDLHHEGRRVAPEADHLQRPRRRGARRGRQTAGGSSFPETSTRSRVRSTSTSSR